MQQCTHCQADLPANAQFCSRCGTPAEESQTSSTHFDEASIREENLETTSKQAVVTAPAAPTLPTLRTRRMHPQSSIPEFPQDPWLPLGSASEDEGRASVDTARAVQQAPSPVLQLPLTPPVETVDDSPLAQEESKEPEASESMPRVQAEETPQALAEAQDEAPDAVTPEVEFSASPAHTHEMEHTTTSTLPEPEPDLISTLPTGDLPQTPAVPALTPDEISTSPTGELEQAPAHPLLAHDDISTFPTDDLVHTPAVSAEASSAVPTGELKYTSPFPPPTPEKRSTPRPVSTMAQPQRQAISSTGSKRAGRTRMLFVALIVALVVLAGGIGAFALLRQNTAASTTAPCDAQQSNCAGGSPVSIHGHPTHLTFSGSVAGLMTIVAQPRCQISTAGNLRVLTVNLSGTINGQLYNFGFVIEHYHGPSTYSNATATITILFDTPGQSTINGWGNSVPTDTGSITVDRGEQTGSISYTLSGVGTQANTQIQSSGNWTCGN